MIGFVFFEYTCIGQSVHIINMRFQAIVFGLIYVEPDIKILDIVFLENVFKKSFSLFWGLPRAKNDKANFPIILELNNFQPVFSSLFDHTGIR